MIKTMDVVKKVLLSSDTAQLAAFEGILNVSAFARQIQPKVESMAKKEVQVGTITTALYRLLDQFSFKNFKPKVELAALALQPNVVALTYEKNRAVLEKVERVLAQSSPTSERFYTLTQGPEEITIIADATLGEAIISEVGPAKQMFSDVVALSVRFGEQYLEVPNTLYALMSRLAVKRINVIEIVSTLTSLTFVIREKEVARALESLRQG